MIKPLFLICFCVLVGLTRQDENYQIVFGDDYEDAIEMVKIKKDGALKLYKSDTLQAKKALAVVFPELIRYSMVRDFFETAALEIFYIQNGKESADFSIGPFQMKPSFIEDLEFTTSKKYPDFYQQIAIKNTLNDKEERKIRLERLKNERWQLIYLKVFIALYMEKESLSQFDFENQVAYLAYAFNHGIKSSIAEKSLEVILTKSQYFPYGTNYKGKQYSYAAIACFFYNTYHF